MKRFHTHAHVADLEASRPISGAHFNPAVSLVMASRGQLAWPRLAPYVAMQLLDAMLARGWPTRCST
jgi:glycerol uptake facilitator-like aquaporin